MVGVPRISYFVADVDDDFYWPSRVARLPYDGRTIHLYPPTRTSPAQVVLESLFGEVNVAGGLHVYDAQQKRLSRFLSSLAWSERVGFVVTRGAIVPNPPPQPTGQVLRATRPDPDGYWLVTPRTDDQRGALATMRVARAARFPHPAVGFLWFYRAIETAARVSGVRGYGKTSMVPYIDALVPSMSGAGQAMAGALGAVGQHIYAARRCAVAHAFFHGMHDPDDAADARSIRDDLPIVEELAEVAVRRDLGVPSAFDLIDADRAGRPNAMGAWVQLQY